MNTAILLSVAYMLGAVNYYLGTLLLALPIPHRGVKRAARLMVQDGVIYSTLAPVAFALPAAMQVAEMYFNYDSQAAFVRLFNWLGFTEHGQPIAQGVIEEITSVYASVIMKIMLSSILPVFGKAISQLQLSYADALTTVLSGAVLSLQFWFYWALFIWKLGLPFLASLGALIYGLPARFGRHAGAALIAISLVFYVGLPFMPYFIGMFSLPEAPRSSEIAALVDAFAKNVTQYNKKYGPLCEVRWNIRPRHGPLDNYSIFLMDGTVWWTDGEGKGAFPVPPGEYSYTISHFGDVEYLSGTFSASEQEPIEINCEYPTWNLRIITAGKESIGDVLDEPTIQDVSSYPGGAVIRVKLPEGLGTVLIDVSVNNKTRLGDFRIEQKSASVSFTERDRSSVYRISIDLEKYGNATRTLSFSAIETAPTEHYPRKKLPLEEDREKDTKVLFADQSKIFRPMFDFSSVLLLTTIVLPLAYHIILLQVGRRVARALGGRKMPLPEVG